MTFPRTGTCLALIASWLCASTLAAQSPAANTVLESAREIPVAYDVDVVVVGGSTGAVAAAVEAANEGASVFLAAPRPYLGEDVCGTLRLWLDAGETTGSPFERSLFSSPTRVQSFPGSVKYTYEADQRANPVHPDRDPPSRLRDGMWRSAAKESVQYDQDVTLVADLGRNVRVKNVHLLFYQRTAEFEVADVRLWTSPNGTLWRDLGTSKNTDLGAGSFEDDPLSITIGVKQPSRYVKMLVRKTPGSERMLLGELIVEEDGASAAPPAEVKTAPPPMQVKIALDQALLNAGVKFLYGCAVTDLLRDGEGRPAGIVMANRAGRQAVKAKVVIDATARATAARLAGARFDPFPAGPQTFQRIVVGGTPHPGPGTAVEPANVKFVARNKAHDAFVYTLEIPMKDGSFASFAEAEQVARDRTFDPAQVDASDVLFQVPPDPVVAEHAAESDAVDPEALDLRCLTPAGLDRLYVLGGCADVSRTAAAQLLRPLRLIRLGRRVGAAAAEEARAAPPLAGVSLARSSQASPDKAADEGEVREFLQGVRPTHSDRPTVPSPARGLPVLGRYDVVVVGGGTGGAPAGIGAARKGAKTLVIEYQDGLGGVGTLGLISLYYHGYRQGFTAEVDAGVKAMGGPSHGRGWNIACKKQWWRREIRQAGGDIWFSTLGCGSLVRDRYVRGVVVTTPMGRGVVLAETVVDSTGNADIAAAAGAATITTSAEHVAMQGTGLSPRALGAGYTNTDYSFVDESDPVDQWRMIVTSRRKYRGSYDLSSFIDSRERRRIVGDFFVTPLDLINQRTYPDSISIHSSNFDTHGYTVHPIFLVDFPDKKGMKAFVPYRALLPKGLEGILVTGLGISAHRDAMPVLRMQACIQNQGYAAGTAAATAARDRTSTRSIDLEALQEHLVEIGSLTPDVLDAADSYPYSAERIAEAVRSVVQDHRGLSVIMAHPDQARPLLREAYQAATLPDHRLTYANILGMMGDPTGSEALIAAIDGQPWDVGWNFRGMGQFGGSISRMDSLIIALGRSGDPKGLPAILRKLEQLDATKEFSHHRAVALALEAHPNPAAAPHLAALLQKPGMRGFAITAVDPDPRSSGTELRSEPLREIVLARALFRCGDHDGVAEAILRTYEKDLRGLFARHAHAVLKEGE